MCAWSKYKTAIKYSENWLYLQIAFLIILLGCKKKNFVKFDITKALNQSFEWLVFCALRCIYICCTTHTYMIYKCNVHRVRLELVDHNYIVLMFLMQNLSSIMFLSKRVIPCEFTNRNKNIQNQILSRRVVESLQSF